MITGTGSGCCNSFIFNDDGDVFDFSSDTFGFRLKDNEVMDQINTPPFKEDVSSSQFDDSLPRSVIFPSVYDASSKQQQRQNSMALANTSSQVVMGLASFNSNTSRKPISLEGYSIGDEAKLNDLFSFDLCRELSNEDAALDAKSLEVGDAAFILKSDCKWTYAILIDKVVVPDGQSALTFEIGSSRKTFMEAQWGKYVRAIKTTDGTVTDRNAATLMESDPDLSYYESSDSEEDSLNDDSDDSNHDADDTADDTNLARPKGILRNKKDNALDRYLKSKAKVVSRKRSEGSAGYSVQFVHFDITEDAAEEQSLASFFSQRDDYSVMQTDGQPQLVTKVYHTKNHRYMKKRQKNAMRRPELAVMSTSPESSTADSSESWHVGQLLSMFARPVYPCEFYPLQPTDVDESDVIKHEEDNVEETFTIECELQEAEDDMFHEVHVIAVM